MLQVNALLHCGVPKAALGKQGCCPSPASDPPAISVPQPGEVTLRRAAPSGVWGAALHGAVSYGPPAAIRSFCRERAGSKSLCAALELQTTANYIGRMRILLFCFNQEASSVTVSLADCLHCGQAVGNAPKILLKTTRLF